MAICSFFRTASRRPFAGGGGGLVHSWFSATAALTRCIWSMAVAQHQFYLNAVDEVGGLADILLVREVPVELTGTSRKV